jgi:hypothetical protein
MNNSLYYILLKTRKQNFSYQKLEHIISFKIKKVPLNIIGFMRKSNSLKKKLEFRKKKKSFKMDLRITFCWPLSSDSSPFIHSACVKSVASLEAQDLLYVLRVSTRACLLQWD